MIEKWMENLRIPGKPDEWEVKELFKTFKINTPESILFEPGSGIVSKVPEGSLAVKVCDPEILHKTEMGGVYLNINEDGLDGVLKEMYAKFPVSRVLAEKMVSYEGIEFIIGAVVDPDFGPAMMVGAGGILTELYKDVSFRLAPLDRAEAVRMLNELTVAEVLKGYRGSRMDINGLADLIVAVGNIINEMGESFDQLDMNPVVFSDGKWVALDGMVILK